MGCCQSTDHGEDNAGRDIGNIRAAQRNTFAPAPPASNFPSVVGASINPPLHRIASHTYAAPTSTARPNHPIRPPSPLPSSPTHIAHQPPPWTRAQLAREREAFFDTRLSGSREVWAVLRVVAETLRRVECGQSGGNDRNDHVGKGMSATTEAVSAEGNNTGDDDDDDALSTAQALLDAVNLTCPGGRVASGRGRDRVQGGIYDERGTLYELPAWIVRDPDDLLPDETDSHEEKGVLADTPDDTTPKADENGEAEKSPRRRSDFKGKGRAEDFGERISVRVRLSDRARDVVVNVGEHQPVSAILSAVRTHIGLDPDSEGNEASAYSSAKDIQRVRLVYLGKVLDPRRSLAENGWKSSHVVNAFVHLPEELQGPE